MNRSFRIVLAILLLIVIGFTVYMFTSKSKGIEQEEKEIPTPASIQERRDALKKMFN